MTWAGEALSPAVVQRSRPFAGGYSAALAIV
jgi:hypothetical protein